MSRVVYFSIDLHGHVNPTLALMKGLVDRGEEVFYYSGEPFRELIEQTGAVFRSYKEQVGLGTYEGGGIDAFFITADFILGKSQVMVNSLLEEIRDLQPAYILHDSFCYWGKEFARLLGVPGISVFANIAYIDEMGMTDQAYFFETVLRSGNDPVYRKHKDDVSFYRKVMNKASRIVNMKYGLAECNVINDIFCSKEPLNLLFTSKAFQLYAGVFDHSYHFAGYSVFPRSSREEDFPYAKLDGRPLVYISLGTIFNDKPEFYLECLEAFRGSDKQVVMATGNRIQIEDFGTIPDNFIVRASVPQLEILKRAKVFITHGGSNSVHEGLCYEVPMVVVPQSFDQFMGALAVESSGAGLYLKSPDIQASQLIDAVNEVITVPSYRSSCTAMNRSFEAAGGVELAIEQLMAHVGKEIALS